MQVVIFAAGKGSRMGQLSERVPKPMLEVAGKTLLEHKFEALPQEVNEIILVVSYLKDVIQEKYKDGYQAKSGFKKVTFVDQGELLGPGHALMQVKEHIRGPFITMMGDDIYPEEAIKDALASEHDYVITTFKGKSIPTALDIKIDDQNMFKSFEYDHNGEREQVLLDVCLYKLQPDIFNAELVKLEGKKEFGLPHTIINHLEKNGLPAKVHITDGWFKVNDPEDLKRAEDALASEENEKNGHEKKDE